MSRLTILLVLAACTLRPYDFDASATDTDATTTTTTVPDPTTAPDPTTGPSTTTTSTTTGSTTGTTGSTGQTFIKPTDGGTGTKECDQWIEDCPEGQKCQPYSGDGDNAWESLKCVPIVPNPDAVGEPCTVTGSGVSGQDSCELHAMCWNVDPDTGTGTCIAKCIGSPDNPSCEDPASYCLLSAEAILMLCLPGCDPLAQDCPNADLCVPNPMNPDGFICVIDASGEEGQVFDVCEYANACDAGLQCANPALAAECDPRSAGCCLPFCDLSVMPPTCPGIGQQCLPWHEEGQAPPGLENVGTCGLPP
jgi:hypothetical protein